MLRAIIFAIAALIGLSAYADTLVFKFVSNHEIPAIGGHFNYRFGVSPSAYLQSPIADKGGASFTIPASSVPGLTNELSGANQASASVNLLATDTHALEVINGYEISNYVVSVETADVYNKMNVFEVSVSGYGNSLMAIPEPSTIALLGSIGLLKRRKR